MPRIIAGSLREHRALTRQKLFAALSSLLTERGFEHALVGDDDPIAQLRSYVRQQTGLRRVSRPAAGPDLRAVPSCQTQHRRRDHVIGVEEVLRRILTSRIESGDFPAQAIDTTVPLVHACLSGTGMPDDGPDRERAIDATETFVLRAVGAQVPTLA